MSIHMENNKIDFILPWVDPNDLEWQKERKKYDINHNHDDKESVTRFRDMGTLKYVLRSIEKNCPWYNKIYLITTGHIPMWLDINHPKVELITHKELFIDETVLPVFNSNAIEMNLVNIPNLSENFIYLNDDMLIWKPLTVERFFKNTKPVDFFYHSWIPRNKIYELFKGKDTWIDSINNNIKLINKKFSVSIMSKEHLYHKSYATKHKFNNFIYKNIYKKIFWINHWHHPQAYNKSTLKEVYSVYSREMIETTKNKFRSNKDITPYIYRYWHLMSGSFEPYFHDDGLVAQISSFNYLNFIIHEINDSKTINFICFNDQMNKEDVKEFDKISKYLEKYLENKFPSKASFEIVIHT